MLRSEMDIPDLPPVLSEEPVMFFSDVFESFQTASHQAGLSEFWFDIGGHKLQLLFAGQSLVERVRPALCHLACEPAAKADLSIGIFDSASTGVNPPPTPWGPYDYLDRGSIRGYNTERIRCAYYIWSGVLAMLDRERNQAVYWLRDADLHPMYLTGSPLLPILYWWMEGKGSQYVHAGAVGTAEGCALLVGRGGSGKSTSTLACLESELFFLAEDYCLLEIEPTPTIHSLYCSAKVDENSLRLLPHLQPLAENAPVDDVGKSMLFLDEAYGSKFVRSLPLKAILLPTISGKRDTRYRPTTSIHALRALAPSTVFQLPGGGRQAFESMAVVARNTPCFVLETGTEIDQIPRVIGNILAELGT
ncbi:MAG: hypothetical protein J5I90_01070 [Caldilineales bacterium]|nr:hypothetical protein [Caldilineales bacterium]